jgi:hypothetical protein
MHDACCCLLEQKKFLEFCEIQRRAAPLAGNGLS